jgi:hypothetical protein
MRRFLVNNAIILVRISLSEMGDWESPQCKLNACTYRQLPQPVLTRGRLTLVFLAVLLSAESCVSIAF